MFKNFKKLGIVLFLIIATVGMSISAVSAGGEGDTVGEPNTLAIAFLGTIHTHGVAVNGIQYKRWLVCMGYYSTIHTQEYNKDGYPLDCTEGRYYSTSPDFIKKFNPNTAYITFYIDDGLPTEVNLKLIADGSHYGGVCANLLSWGHNFRIVGNHYDNGWYTFK
jgi:hypothetical protein